MSRINTVTADVTARRMTYLRMCLLGGFLAIPVLGGAVALCFYAVLLGRAFATTRRLHLTLPTIFVLGAVHTLAPYYAVDHFGHWAAYSSTSLALFAFNAWAIERVVRI